MTYTLTIEGSGNAYDESGSHTLCLKHSIIITPSSSFLNLPDSQLDLSGNYVILILLDAPDSTGAIFAILRCKDTNF